jgi:hypothetical protein
MTEATRPKKDISPRAGAPAGPQFEAKVATHYALGLLAQTEAFGLPGAIIGWLEFQRKGLGHPLDDIIVKAATRSGEQRCLEVQAKRSMAFTEADNNFAAVVAAIVESRKTDPSRRFAVAIERTSGPIENGVQEALELSRHATDAQSFLTLLGTPGRGNEDMRRFVAAFKSHLATHGCGTDAVVFEILKSLSVLVFDMRAQIPSPNITTARARNSWRPVPMEIASMTSCSDISSAPTRSAARQTESI